MPRNNRYREINKEVITKLAVTKEDRLQSLSKSPIFENLIQIVDVSSWSMEENVLSTYCDEEILLVVNHDEKLLSQNGCNMNGTM